jgi:galactose mutarotase-like enzyme
MVCCSLRHGGEELLGQRRGLAAYAETGKTMGIPLLHPWANRLGDWSYEACGRRVDLHGLDGVVGTDGETGLPSHGTLPRPWQVAEASPDAVVAEREPPADAFPFPHRLRYSARVGATRLTIRLELEALDGPVPVCFGFHPYLTLPGVARGDYEVSLPVRRRLLLDDHKLPTGETEAVEPVAGPLGDRVFDDGYDELASPPVFTVSGGGRAIELRFEAGFTRAQVFAPDGQDFICFEPMTARTNALRDGGFPVARPGEPYAAAFSIAVT